MFDSPSPEELLAAVARYLRDDAGPALGASALQANGAALAYQARVAANMLDMVRRQGLLAPAAEAAECQRLRALLGEPGAPRAPDTAGTAGMTGTTGATGMTGMTGAASELASLNQRLTDDIARGRLGLDTPGLADHLWRTTLDKLAVDQPGYAGYLQALASAANTAAPAAPAATGSP
jgi:Domain of unknown function (DUF6285)